MCEFGGQLFGHRRISSSGVMFRRVKRHGPVVNWRRIFEWRGVAVSSSGELGSVVKCRDEFSSGAREARQFRQVERCGSVVK